MVVSEGTKQTPMQEFLETWEGKQFCRKVIEGTKKYFEDPEVRKRFEQWKKERAAQAKGGGYTECSTNYMAIK